MFLLLYLFPRYSSLQNYSYCTGGTCPVTTDFTQRRLDHGRTTAAADWSVLVRALVHVDVSCFRRERLFFARDLCQICVNRWMASCAACTVQSPSAFLRQSDLKHCKFNNYNCNLNRCIAADKVSTISVPDFWFTI